MAVGKEAKKLQREEEEEGMAGGEGFQVAGEFSLFANETNVIPMGFSACMCACMFVRASFYPRFF